VKIKGYQTYITIALWVAYEISSSRGWFPVIPELRVLFLASVAVFLRAGSKRDAAHAVEQIKKDDAPSAP
jgi:hypothetical protein